MKRLNVTLVGVKNEKDAFCSTLDETVRPYRTIIVPFKLGFVS